MTNSKKSNRNSENAAVAANQLLDSAMRAMHSADEVASRLRTQNLRALHPDATDARLVKMLIKKKCMQAGMVGAMTSGAAIVPELGTVATLTIGTLTDIRMSLKMQAELVLEIAEVYGYRFDTAENMTTSAAEKRNILLLVTGASVGAEELLSLGGKRLTQAAEQRLAQRSVLKAIPFVGIGISAGTNMLSTYVIGTRANAYFQLGPAAVGEWGESLRAISGIDERKLTRWLGELLGQYWQTARNNVQRGVVQTSNLLGKMGTSTRKAVKSGTSMVISRYTQTGIDRSVDSGVDSNIDRMSGARGEEEGI